MALSVSGAPTRAGARDLAGAIAREGSVWLWADAANAWLHAGDAIRVTAPASEWRGLSVVDDRGELAVVSSRARRGLSPIADVHELVRARKRWSLTQGFPRALARLAPPRLFHVALRGARPFARALEQLARPPAATHAVDTQRELYDADAVLADGADLSDLSESEAILVERFVRPGQRIADVGCGTGREALALAERDVDVLGLDVSARSVERARERAAVNGATKRPRFRTGTLFDLDDDARFDAIYFGSDVYACIPGRTNRVATLRRAAHLLTREGIVLVQAPLPREHLAAAALDLARAVTARARGEACERGDRFVWFGPPPRLVYRHRFASDEEVARELEDAGLRFVARYATYVVARRAESASETPTATSRDPWLVELARAARAMPEVDRLRRREGPIPAARALRARAATAPRRDPVGRARLARAIAWCDRAVPVGGGCYRRVLMEIALDAGAAEEPLYLGFTGLEGHAWLERFAPAERYDSVVEV